MIGKVLHVLHRPLENADIEAIVVVEMYMHARDGEVMVATGERKSL